MLSLQVTLIFEAFDIEYQVNCDWDSLQVYEGTTITPENVRTQYKISERGVDPKTVSMSIYLEQMSDRGVKYAAGTE